MAVVMDVEITKNHAMNWSISQGSFVFPTCS